MPVGHVVLKIYVPCKTFHMPNWYLYKPCKAYIYCWEKKYMPILKNHLPNPAHNHKSLCALGQDLHACGQALMCSPASNNQNRTTRKQNTTKLCTYYLTHTVYFTIGDESFLIIWAHDWKISSKLSKKMSLTKSYEVFICFIFQAVLTWA